MKIQLQPGLLYLPGYFAPEAQRALADEVAGALEAAPLFTPKMPRSGKPFSVRMSNFGPLGWVSDVNGYRYQPHHPETGAPWPPLPTRLAALWEKVSGFGGPPEACLINFYAPGAKMGLHQDRDEAEMNAPVVSVSLGDEAVFRYKGTSRTGKSASIRLKSGDVLVMGGESRLAYHGIDRVIGNSSALLAESGLGEGRINLTLRRITSR